MPLDNLYKTQPKVREDILSTFNSQFLPQSLLFTGPRGSSKLTAALDLAFLITKNEENRDNLRSQDIIFIPHRDMIGRVSSAINLFESNRNNRTRIFLLETIRTVLLQYHSALYTASQDKLFSDAGEIDSALMDFEEDRDYSETEIIGLTKFLRDKCLNSKFLYCGKKVPTAVSIDQVRLIQEFFASTGEEKVAILEDIEDSTEGAKNSLLKMLEEPQNKAHVILLSHSPQRIIETILSRVRKFSFPALGSKAISNFLKKEFGEWKDYSSFDEFFFQKGRGEEKRTEFEKDSLALADIIFEGKGINTEEEERILSSLESLSAWGYFRERVIKLLENAVINRRVSERRAKEVLTIINRFQENTEIYNMNQRVAFDLMIREALIVK